MMKEVDFMERYKRLKEMHFSGMAAELKVQYEDPQIGKLSSEERIFRLIDAESETRNNKKFQRLIKSANLRYPEASINDRMLQVEGVDNQLLKNLANCDWIETNRNLLITGKTGAGKSYCACALGVAAASSFKTVKYYKAAILLWELQSAEAEKTLTTKLNQLSKYDLLIIDDFGLMNLDSDLCRNLFELIDCRSGLHSSIFVSQLPVSKWYGLFKENTYADACLDRLTGNSYRLEFNGESMRKNRPE